MFVLNHISWLDIFLIDATFPATFVAKAEIRSWPLVGWLCTEDCSFSTGAVFDLSGGRATY